ncbi:MAG: phosphatase PAP2 family protein [Bacteroidota bacterium]
MKLPGLFAHLRALDALNIFFLVFLSGLALFFAGKIPVWNLLIAANLLGGVIIYFISIPPPHPNSFVKKLIRDWYVLPLVFLVFKEIYIVIQSLARDDYDHLLIDIDRKIFGCDPTVWLSKYTAPLLTEILQIAYASYFIIMFTVALELYLRDKKESHINYLFTLMLGFYISYIGYLIVPAIGPRFTLHDFKLLDKELPGLYFAVPLRDFLNAAESIPKNSPDAWMLAQRDVFPSGHTAMTLIALFFAAKYHLKSRWFLYVAGVLLIIATVYLRYHYVVDLIGGALTMLMVVALAPIFLRWWEKVQTTSLRSTRNEVF